MENNNNNAKINTAVNSTNSNKNSTGNKTCTSNDSNYNRQTITINAQNNDGFGFTLSRIYVNKSSSSDLQDSQAKVNFQII